METIELFTTSSCPKCEKLSLFLETQGIKYVKRIIDLDPDAETEALMINLYSAPAIKTGESVLKTSQIFNKEMLLEGNVKSFLKIQEKVQQKEKVPEKVPEKVQQKVQQLIKANKNGNLFDLLHVK